MFIPLPMSMQFNAPCFQSLLILTFYEIILNYCAIIRKYGSTFYIRITMVILPYIGIAMVIFALFWP